MTIFALYKTLRPSPVVAKTRSRKALANAFLVVACLGYATLGFAQKEPAAGGAAARQRGAAASSVRIEAAGFIQWSKSPIDPSHGASNYWMHISAEGAREVTGGFTIDAHPRISGKFTSLVVNGAPVGRAAITRPAPGKPSTGTLTGTFNYEKKDYSIVIDFVGDVWKPSPTPGGKGGTVRGSLRLKATDTASKAVNAATGVKQTSVTLWLK